jgi:hypothetical protein
LLKGPSSDISRLKGLIARAANTTAYEIFQAAYTQIRRKIIANEEHKSIDKVIKEICLDRVELVRKNTPLIKTVALESFYHPELIEPIRREIAPKLIPIIDKFTEDNINKGVFRDVEPRVVTRVLMSSMIGYLFFSNLFPQEFKGENEEAEIEKSIDILLNGILNKGEGAERNE